MDPNELQAFADQSMRAGRYKTALEIYHFLADGDPSLDGGSLAHAIGQCHEQLGEPFAARFWYGRAAEENPAVELYRRDAERTRDLRVEDLVESS
jgi:tetratricopeptide (TPR) repeat protein